MSVPPDPLAFCIMLRAQGNSPVVAYDKNHSMFSILWTCIVFIYMYIHTLAGLSFADWILTHVWNEWASCQGSSDNSWLAYTADSVIVVRSCFMWLQLKQLVQSLTCLISQLVWFCNTKLKLGKWKHIHAYASMGIAGNIDFCWFLPTLQVQQLQSLHPGTPQCKGLQLQASRVTSTCIVKALKKFWKN